MRLEKLMPSQRCRQSCLWSARKRGSTCKEQRERRMCFGNTPTPCAWRLVASSSSPKHLLQILLPRGQLEQRALLFCCGGFRVTPLRKYVGHTWTIIGYSRYSGRWLARLQSPQSRYWETEKVLGPERCFAVTQVEAGVSWPRQLPSEGAGSALA